MDYSLAARKLFIADLRRCKPCRGVEARILFELDGLRLQRVWIQGIVMKAGSSSTENDSAGGISSENGFGGARGNEFERNYIDDGSGIVMILSARGSNSYSLSVGKPFITLRTLLQFLSHMLSSSTLVRNCCVLPTGQYVQVVGMLSLQPNGDPVIRVSLGIVDHMIVEYHEKHH